MKTRGTFLVIALLATATAVSACRKETPEPLGLGGPKVPPATVTQ